MIIMYQTYETVNEQTQSNAFLYKKCYGFVVGCHSIYVLLLWIMNKVDLANGSAEQNQEENLNRLIDRK